MNNISAETPQDLRIWFCKKDSAKYISHLDLLRTFTRALRRAKLPVWYTQGFNKHIYVTFAAPLSLGYEGLLESMDVKMVEEMDFTIIADTLNAVLPIGLEILKVSVPIMKAGKITHGVYEVTLPYTEKIHSFMKLDSVISEKKSKRGKIRELELSTYIKNIIMTKRDENMIWEINLPASSADNINPKFIVNAFSKYAELPDLVDCAKIVRKKLLANNEDFV